MARSRYVSPAFFEDTRISELTISTRLLYIGLWQIMDCRGICPDDVKLIKGHVFRYDEKVTQKQVAEMIEELIQAKRLRRVAFEGASFLHCPTLSEHQHFHKSEVPKYLIPDNILNAPLDTGAVPVQASEANGTSRLDNGEWIIDNGERSMENPTPVGPRAHWLADLWNQHCGHLPKCREVSPTRKKAIAQRLRDNPNPDYWQEVVHKLAASDFCNARTGGTWRATFDWMLASDNHLKILEGKYDNRGAAPRQREAWELEELRKEQEAARRKNAV